MLTDGAEELVTCVVIELFCDVGEGISCKAAGVQWRPAACIEDRTKRKNAMIAKAPKAAGAGYAKYQLFISNDVTSKTIDPSQHEAVNGTIHMQPKQATN